MEAADNLLWDGKRIIFHQIIRQFFKEMAISRKKEEDGLIITLFSGKHTYNDAVQALDDLLLMKRDEHEIFELVINCKDVELVFSRAEEKLIVEKIQETFSHFESGGLAIVAKTDLVFGLSRVLQSSIEKERIAVAVFRSEELARRWIEEVRYLHTQPHVAAEG